MKAILFSVGALLIVLLASCSKPDAYPVTPSLRFISFTKFQDARGKDYKGTLNLSFTDGDGDIGRKEGDTLQPYNFFIRYFEKQAGVFKEVPLKISNDARIPYLTPEGKNKSLSGEISIQLLLAYPGRIYDTIRYDCYVMDRALHKSNLVNTPEIVVIK